MKNMVKNFIVKNSAGEKLGKIIYLEGKFKIDLADNEEMKNLKKLLDSFLRGIRDLGEVILKEPIKLGDPLFLNEVRNQLARKGYILIENK